MTVEMSLHGSRPETHDRATATAGSFEALLRGLDRLRERGVSMTLKTPLTRLNEDELDSIAKKGIHPRELEKAKNRMSAAFVFGLQTNIARSQRLAEGVAPLRECAANAADVTLVDCGRGLQVLLVATSPRFRETPETLRLYGIGEKATAVLEGKVEPLEKADRIFMDNPGPTD